MHGINEDFQWWAISPMKKVLNCSKVKDFLHVINVFLNRVNNFHSVWSIFNLQEKVSQLNDSGCLIVCSWTDTIQPTLFPPSPTDAQPSEHHIYETCSINLHLYKTWQNTHQSQNSLHHNQYKHKFTVPAETELYLLKIHMFLFW